MFLGKSDQLLGYNKTRFDVLYLANACHVIYAYTCPILN
jgi:hypothetical protein